MSSETIDYSSREESEGRSVELSVDDNGTVLGLLLFLSRDECERLGLDGETVEYHLDGNTLVFD